MSKDLLKEAIADAKAVRETAIANAKLALEEAFTPKLQSMLSAKIQEEEMDEDEVEVDDVAADSTDIAVADDDTEDTGTDAPADETYEEGEDVEETYNEGEEKEEGMKEEDMEEAEEKEEAYHEEIEEDAELDEIIKELEEEDMEEDMEETMDEAKVVDEDKVDEAKDVDEDMEEDMDENLNLDEVIKALQEDEMEEDEKKEEGMYEDELEEAYKTIRSLKATINEVNLLNAKLLFSNKLFRGNDLNESQKMKVIETFDRANSVREVKLVYTTLAESFSGYTPKRKKNITEGFASKTSKSTKPAKGMIVEGNDFANRMKKLAGLL